MKTFKSLLSRITAATTREEFDAICGDIERAFGQDKLKFDEYEILFGIIRRLYNF